MIETTTEFDELLRDCHLQASYEDVSGRRHRASTDALIALLNALGVELQDVDQAGHVLERRRQQRLLRGVEPVYVAWDGSLPDATITLPAGTQQPIHYVLDVGSDQIARSYKVDELPFDGSPEPQTSGFERRKLPVPGRLPWGYHPWHIHVGGSELRSLVISAPRTAFAPPADVPGVGERRLANGYASDAEPPGLSGRRGREPRAWGCFLPLYALRTERDWGVGDFTALRELVGWTGRLGGSNVGTLPLLAAFLDEPLEISPYRPVSRLFWNELYLDVEAIPEWQRFEDVRRLRESPDLNRRIAERRESELVDYRGVMKLKRQVLEQLAERFFAERPPRFGELQKFLADNPAVTDYARFRAAGERQQKLWPDWPARMRSGDLEERDYHQAAVNYHQYAQWIAIEQLRELRAKADERGCGLYLDLPVGVDPGGYDTWRHPSVYASGVRVGAPPDVIFDRGQDWGLPPFHPDRIRESGYDLFRRGMSNNMRFARRLRIDHVMGLHRLYWIPPGFEADEGAYVEYPAEELYAVAILESYAHCCALVGENLGTVPPEVEEALTAHGLAGMWVAPYELEPGRRSTLSGPPPQHVAMLNTHDMPPLAAWWQGDDIAHRRELGLIDEAGAERERVERGDATRKLRDWLQSTGAVKHGEIESEDEAPLRPLLRALASSPAHMVLVNLEDLWLEKQPQNVPGNFENQPNWRRKARHKLEEFREAPQVLEALAEVNSLRKHQEPRR